MIVFCTFIHNYLYTYIAVYILQIKEIFEYLNKNEIHTDIQI